MFLGKSAVFALRSYKYMCMRACESGLVESCQVGSWGILMADSNMQSNMEDMLGNYPLRALLGASWVTGCPSAYMLKLVYGFNCVCPFPPLLQCFAIWQQIVDFERQGHLPPPPPVSVSSNLITQPPPLPRPFFHLSFSLRSQLFLHLPQSPPLFPVSDFLLQTNERSEDDTYSQKMNDPSVESEKGREWKKNTNTLRPLIAPPLKESQINI